jgi:hypothetical protein
VKVPGKTGAPEIVIDKDLYIWLLTAVCLSLYSLWKKGTRGRICHLMNPRIPASLTEFQSMYGSPENFFV